MSEVEGNIKETLERLISKFVANINSASQAILELSLGSVKSKEKAKEEVDKLTEYIQELEEAEVQCLSTYPLSEEVSPLFNQIVTSILPRAEMSLRDLNEAMLSPPQDYALLKEIQEITGGELKVEETEEAEEANED